MGFYFLWDEAFGCLKSAGHMESEDLDSVSLWHLIARGLRQVTSVSAFEKGNNNYFSGWMWKYDFYDIREWEIK